MANVYILRPSARQGKKWSIETPSGKTINFGAEGYEDYTIHKDAARKESYIKRHRANENWGKSGINTAGFWSRHLLWGEPSLTRSISEIQNKFNVKIIKKSK